MCTLKNYKIYQNVNNDKSQSKNTSLNYYLVNVMYHFVNRMCTIPNFFIDYCIKISEPNVKIEFLICYISR